MFIRRAGPKDVALLAALGRRTFWDAFAADNEQDMQSYVASAFDPARIGAVLQCPDTVFWLAYAHRVAIGYAQLTAASQPPCTVGPKPVELARLYVDRQNIGTGGGARLMQTCLDWAAEKGYRSLWLGVWAQNFRAIQFYRGAARSAVTPPSRLSQRSGAEQRDGK